MNIKIINPPPFMNKVLVMSFLLLLFQNECWCTSFHMEMSLICETVNIQLNLVSI